MHKRKAGLYIVYTKFDALLYIHSTLKISFLFYQPLRDFVEFLRVLEEH